MASTIFTNAKLVVSTSTSAGTRDISNRLMEVELSEEFEEHDDTTMGLTSRSRAIGLGTWSINCTVLQAFATADGGENIDQLVNTWRDISSTGNKFLVELRKANADRDNTNPEYSGLVVMRTRQPLRGAVGDLLTQDIEFLSAGDLTRTTATS